jgi:NAD(P)-dependent dehydrogenase (short-subunit alcohol dehydrogenase family)
MPDVALVTGAGRGLGREVALGLAARGLRVICHARDAGRAAEVAGSIGGEAVTGELGSEAGVAALAREVQRCTDRLDLLVHNAGVMPSGSVRDTSWATLMDALAVNAVAPILLTRLLLPLLEAAPRPRVVVVSTQMGRLSTMRANHADNVERYGTLLPYRVSKTAVNGFVAVADAELGDRIDFVTLHPGWIRTDMGGPDADLDPAEAAAEVVRVALDREGVPSGSFVVDGRLSAW